MSAQAALRGRTQPERHRSGKKSLKSDLICKSASQKKESQPNAKQIKITRRARRQNRW